jgi:hypothetical protein
MKSREDILHDKVEKIYKNRAADFEEEKRKLNWEANFSYRILITSALTSPMLEDAE